nr:hypothetical protein [Tanacetum cinerariifolium]
AIATIHDMTDNGYDVGIPEDWVHDSYKLQTWMNVYSHKETPKKIKKSKEEIVMVKENKLTSQRNESVPKKTTRTKRTSSVTGTSIAAAEVGTQASQAGIQASTGSTFKRTRRMQVD